MDISNGVSFISFLYLFVVVKQKTQTSDSLLAVSSG